MKKNILLLATLFISSNQLFGFEQSQKSITSYSQENSSDEEATNHNSDSIQSRINTQELLSFAANFVANNPEAINNVNPPASGSSSSSSIFPQNTLLPIMIDRKEKPSQFRCPLCNIYDEGRPKQTIIDHISTHTQEKHFQCSLCIKKFKTNGTLQRHIKSTHHGLNQFKCPECESNFRRRDKCLQHMKNVCKTSKTLIKLTSASLQSASSSSTVLSQEIIDDSKEEEEDNDDSDFSLPSVSSSSCSFGITHINMKDLAAVTYSSVFNQNQSSASSSSSSTVSSQKMIDDSEEEEDDDSDFPLPSASSSSSFFGITHINMTDLAAITHSSVFNQNTTNGTKVSENTWQDNNFDITDQQEFTGASPSSHDLNQSIEIANDIENKEKNSSTSSSTSSSSSSSTTPTQNDVLPIKIDGTKNPALYKCPFCNIYNAGRRMVDMKNHIQNMHTKIQKFECSICKKLFKQKGHFNIHKRTHTKNYPFSCTKCGKGFNTKYNLESHMRRITPCMQLPVSSSSSTTASSSSSNSSTSQEVVITDNIKDDNTTEGGSSSS